MADTLSRAVEFHFDEHISPRYLVDFALGIQKFPEKDDHKRLTRVLAIIEQAACRLVWHIAWEVQFVVGCVQVDA